MKKSKLLSIYMIIILILFILSFSIAVPILFRPFYYWHIKLLNLVQETGYDYQTIKTAYDEMMNFCLGLTNTFSTGSLKYSAEGMAHFVDCRYLFLLDIGILIFSSLNLIIVPVIMNKLKIESFHFYNHTNGYYASTILITAFIFIVGMALPDFDKAFTTFHKIFFPGKSNWIFDPRYDQIINILPETFFMNCAICIVAILFIICILLIVHDRKKRYKL